LCENKRFCSNVLFFHASDVILQIFSVVNVNSILSLNQLEIRRKAQREAARRPMPDCGDDLGFEIPLLATPSVERNRISLCMHRVDFGRVKMGVYNIC